MPIRPRKHGPQIDSGAIDAPVAGDTTYSRRAVRLVLTESTLWAAGNALTTGAFLMYFARDLGAAGTMIGIIAAVPETSGILRLFAPALIRRLGNRKRTVIAASIAARLLSLGIPAVALARPSPAGLDPLWLFVAFLFASQACQWIGYVAYVSWLCDVVPSVRWGRFFAARNVCILLVVLVIPVVAGAARDHWIEPSRPVLFAYAVPFVLGVAFMTASLAPLARVPHAQPDPSTHPTPTRSRSGTSGTRTSGTGVSPVPAWRDPPTHPPLTSPLAPLADRSFRRLVLYNGWLALFSGLMQAPFFLFVKNQLLMGLAVTSAGYSLMRLCQIPVGLAAGRLSDRIGDRPVLVVGLLGVAASVLFLLPATSDRWWLVYGTFTLWGAWAAVNICQQNLMLAVAPATDNAAHVALFQAVGGLCAGISGIAGGWLLDQLTHAKFSLSLGPWQCGPFAMLFLVSGIGRALAVAWLPPAHTASPRRSAPPTRS